MKIAAILTLLLVKLLVLVCVCVSAQTTLELLLDCAALETADEIIQCSTQAVAAATGAATTGTTTADSLSCVQDSVTLFDKCLETNTVVECTAISLDCVNATLQGIYADLAAALLDPCVRTTTAALRKCALENAVTCATNCSAAAQTDNRPLFFQDTLVPSDVATCGGIQSNILDPTCDVVSCCPDCLDELEAVAECVVNDVFGFTFFPCDFTCSRAAASRKLQDSTSMSSSTSSTTTAGANSGVGILETCVDQLVPGGLTTETTITNTATAQELATRAPFFDCVVGEFFGIMEQQAREQQDNVSNEMDNVSNEMDNFSNEMDNVSNENSDASMIMGPQGVGVLGLVLLSTLLF
jgi:hypothetical protein